MAEPTPDLIRAARAACNVIFVGGCHYPTCRRTMPGCSEYESAIRAALAALAKPSAEMVRAGRAEIKPDNLPADDGDARQCWRAMMRKVLGDGNV